MWERGVHGLNCLYTDDTFLSYKDCLQQGKTEEGIFENE